MCAWPGLGKLSLPSVKQPNFLLFSDFSIDTFSVPLHWFCLRFVFLFFSLSAWKNKKMRDFLCLLWPHLHTHWSYLPWQARSIFLNPTSTVKVEEWEHLFLSHLQNPRIVNITSSSKIISGQSKNVSFYHHMFQTHNNVNRDKTELIFLSWYHHFLKLTHPRVHSNLWLTFWTSSQ